jgi:hypothetical protein
VCVPSLLFLACDNDEKIALASKVQGEPRVWVRVEVEVSFFIE